MPRYMPQDVFEFAVSTVSVGVLATGKSTLEIAAEIWAGYHDLLADDPVATVTEIIETSEDSLAMLERLEPSMSSPERQMGFLHHFVWYCRTFDESGKRRGFRLFNGLWFCAPKTPEANRKSRYIGRMGVYLIAIQSGTAPLAPPSWTPH